MKKIQFLSISLVLGLGVLFSSCESLKNMAKQHATVKYEVKPNPLEMHGDKVKVEINGTIPGKYFWNKAMVVFQPSIVYEGGQQDLKPFVLRGVKTQGQGTVIDNKTGGKFSYSDEVPFVPQMEQSRLVVNPVGFPEKSAAGKEVADAAAATQLAKNLKLGDRQMAEGMMITSTRIDKEGAKPAIVPDKYEKETVIPHLAYIYYLVDTYNLNWNFALNKKAEAKAAIKALDSLFNTGMEMKSVEIKAWASPEGEESRNQNLSDNRAKTAVKYFNTAYDNAVKKLARQQKVKPASIKQNIEPQVQSMGEDWDKFIADLRASDIAERNTIINVISSHPDREAREQEIRNMTVIYKQIEDNILPPLRRAEMQVNFLEPKKTDEEIAQLSLTEPSELKVEELLYAATLTEDKENQLKIYLSATEVYPEEYRGFNNAAALYIEKHEYDQAQALLETALGLQPEDGAVLNNMGAIAMARGDMENARANFENALKTGNAEAGFNMGMLDIKDGNYAKGVSAMGGEKCVYNLALAQLMNGQLDEAKATLNCMETITPDAYYLLAVIAARQNNKADLANALRQAVEGKSALKAQAQKDVEFINFRDDAEIQNIIR
ncbi:MAG: hypothetical protein J1F29_02290 [Lentimicrobiaceae bacterium]|nr:hypothetical protein [Lentimicrobiaceae bacterium]